MVLTLLAETSRMWHNVWTFYQQSEWQKAQRWRNVKYARLKTLHEAGTCKKVCQEKKRYFTWCQQRDKEMNTIMLENSLEKLCHTPGDALTVCPKSIGVPTLLIQIERKETIHNSRWLLISHCDLMTITFVLTCSNNIHTNSFLSPAPELELFNPMQVLHSTTLNMFK